MKEIEVIVKPGEIFERDDSLLLRCIKASAKKPKFKTGRSNRELIMPSDRNLRKIRKHSVGTMRSQREELKIYEKKKLNVYTYYQSGPT